MKVLLLSPQDSSVTKAFEYGFKKVGAETHVSDYTRFTSERLIMLDHRAGSLPGRIRNKIRHRLLHSINLQYKKIILNLKPNLVLIYNDSMVSDQLVRELKKDGIKFNCFLADTPYLLHRRGHMLKLLFEMDYVLSPDTYRIEQMQMIGIRKTEFLLPGFDEKTFYPYNPNSDKLKKYQAEVFYLGSPYGGIWGYKRAMFLNQFTSFDFKVYGSAGWNRWFSEFPELKESLVILHKRISDAEVNDIMNCCRIYPIDMNPAIIHGFHIRILDCLGAGILPLIEFRSDLESVFPGMELPVIRSYPEAIEKTSYYLQNEKKRKETINKMREVITSGYSAQSAAELILKLMQN